MALRTFVKKENFKGLFGIEKITLIYDLLTSILILFLFHLMDHPFEMLIERSIIAVACFSLIYIYRRYPCKITTFVRIAVNMSLLAYWYPDTYEFNRVLPNLDHVFASVEQSLFDCQPALLFCQRWSNVWISEAFNMGYFSYYPMIGAVTLFYFFCRYEHFEKVSFIIVASFFIYYLIYIFVPVAGPQFYFPAIGMDNVVAGNFPSIGDYFNNHCELLPGSRIDKGLFYKLVEESQQVGERPTAAFPSSHVGISTILMIMSWRGSKKLFIILIPFYILLCGATVYIQAHYLIDVIAGFISAFIIYWGVCKMYKHWFAVPMFKVD